jgi:cold shock CspA family protein
MFTGTVKFFNVKNKFGFVKCNEDGKEYYVHAKNVEGEQLNQNDYVQFELKDTKRGSEAVQVKKV